MKNFEEFKKSLSKDVMNEIYVIAKEKAEQKYIEVYGNDKDNLSKVFIIESYKNTYITLALLEKYHIWNNE